MAEIDYLIQRTTNLNIRISPMLKTQLIDSGARQGLNLSDYVMHILTVEMSGGNKPEAFDIEENEKYQNLMEEYNHETEAKQLLQIEKVELQKQLKAYEDLEKGFRSYVGQTFVVGSEQVKVNNTFDVLKFIVKLFKFEQLK